MISPAIAVPLMLFSSSLIMALAWLGHMRFTRRFLFALLTSWFLVLPEYLLNVAALRYGIEIYTGTEMAAFNLCSGVLCVALVSRFVLGEPLDRRQVLGFVLMAGAILLVVYD